MTVFYVTFGQKYRTEPHPVLGDRPDLPDGWLTITADSMDAARERVFDTLGTVTPYGTEPGSTVEWNPDCPVHKLNEQHG